jgi:hypothetical protein
LPLPRTWHEGATSSAAGCSSSTACSSLRACSAIERATGGWGLSITFFREPHLLSGPGYATWLTSFVLLSALFVYGMWYGIVNRRWGMLGLIAFIVVQVLAVLAVRFASSWSGVGVHLAGLSALGQTGGIAALAVVFLAGGHATIRRITV